MACVAPKNNSVVIKMNKPSPGFFKRHGLAGVINGNEDHTAGNFKGVLNICFEWVDECIGLCVWNVWQIQKCLGYPKVYFK